MIIALGLFGESADNLYLDTWLNLSLLMKTLLNSYFRLLNFPGISALIFFAFSCGGPGGGGGEELKDACPGDCKLSYEEGFVGATGTCEAPCECWLMSLGEDGKWKREVRADNGWVESTAKGYSAMCLSDDATGEGTSPPSSDTTREWRVSLTTKTYIPPNYTVGFAGQTGQMNRASDLVNAISTALQGNDLVSNEDPADLEYRLFSRGNLAFTCNGNNISDVTHYDLSWSKKRGVLFDDNTGVGNEGSGTIPGIGKFTFSPDVGIISVNESARVDASTWRFKWKFKGRPTPPAEIGFNYVRNGLNGINTASRTSYYIWHEVEGQCFCRGGKGYWKASWTGSAFPSHGGWFFDERIKNPTQDLMAQDMDNLWQPNPGISEEVVFRTATPKSLTFKGVAR
jgi:hypothetical protein